MAYFITASASSSVVQTTFDTTGSIITSSLYTPNDPLNVDNITTIKKSRSQYPNLNRPIYKESVSFTNNNGTDINWLYNDTASRDTDFNLIKTLNTNYEKSGGGGSIDTGSLLLTASVVSNTITFTKGNGSTFPITVDTGSGGGIVFPYSGSAIITGSLLVTGSIISTLGFTGSLQGTSSYATQALSASWAPGGSTPTFPYTGSAIISGSLTITGSLLGNVQTLAIVSSTASMDLSRGNFFTLTLASSSITHLSPTNIRPGQTINLEINQPATSGSLTYGSAFKFPGGIPYSASATGSVTDILSMISFNSTTLYATAIKNLS